MLLLINGPPGVGKSTIAQRYADEHARSLVVEIDALRTQLGGWSTDDASKQLARDLAVPFVEVALLASVDVAARRFRLRRAGLEGSAHPESDLADAMTESIIGDAVTRLASAPLPVDASGDRESTYLNLCRALGSVA